MRKEIFVVLAVLLVCAIGIADTAESAAYETSEEQVYDSCTRTCSWCYTPTKACTLSGVCC